MLDLTGVAEPLRIFLSAGPYTREGYVATQQDELDLLKPEDWQATFGARRIRTILAEHVWEHLTVEEARRAARQCFAYLEPGGYVRCGVPDALFPDAEYQARVAVNGPGPAADHKVVYDYRTLTEVFASAGFDVRLREWWDEAGQFHRTEWDPADGLIYRSLRFDPRNADGIPRFTSLILDGFRP